ncbi:MAG: hypothetical protein HMLKMBBP_01925 [Planctomycetes bacterium]|nr:hypothetical protein [Planctomycetota bacterium]
MTGGQRAALALILIAGLALGVAATWNASGPGDGRGGDPGDETATGDARTDASSTSQPATGTSGRPRASRLPRAEPAAPDATLRPGVGEALPAPPAPPDAASAPGAPARGPGERASAGTPFTVRADGSVGTLEEFSALLGGAPLVEVPGTELRFGAHVRTAGRGLMTERGIVPWSIALRLNKPHAAALEFAVEVVPAEAGSVRTPRARLRAGATLDTVDYAPVRAGQAQVRITLLDGSGAPTGRVAVVDILGASLSDQSEPMIYVAKLRPADCGAGLDSADARGADGFPGHPLGNFRVGRGTFRDEATRATEVEIRADDPSGVLGPLPRSVTVAAGETESPPFEIRLTERTGDARLKLASGASTFEYRIRSLTRSAQPIPPVVVPLGARAVCKADWERPTRVRSPGTAVVADPTVASAVVVRSPDHAYATVEAEITPLKAGTTTVALASVPFPPAVVAVECVPAESRCVGGRFTLIRRSAGQTGEVRLSAPAGGRLTVGTLPSGVRAFASADGREVTLSIDANAGSGDLEVPLQFDGASAVHVQDRTRGGTVRNYVIDAR